MKCNVFGWEYADETKKKAQNSENFQWLLQKIF